MTQITRTDRQLLPPLTPQQKVAVMLRILFHEGYDDHLAGHITFRQPDGTLLANPWELSWDEIRPEDVVRIDVDGKVLEGHWTVTPAIKLHLELHKRREVKWAMHNHARWSTIYADLKRIPPVYDQTGAGVPDSEICLFDEYDGDVAHVENAAAAAEAMGDHNIALLAHHGVFISANSTPQLLHRSIAIEWRSRQAWHVETVNPNAEPMKAEVANQFGSVLDQFGGIPGQFEALARRELRRDPTLLDG